MKFGKFFSAIALLASIAIACEEMPQGNEDTNTDKPTPEQPTPEPEKQALKADITLSNAFNWSEGDAVALLSANAQPVLSSQLTQAGATGSFEFDAEAGSYKIVFPFKEGMVYGEYINEISAVQTQQEAGMANMANLLFLSENDVQLTAESKNVELKMQGSLICFNVYGGNADETVLSAGFYTSEVESRVDLANPATVAGGEDAAQKLYLAVAPATAQNLTYYVVTNEARYEFSNEQAVTFEEGKVQNVTLNLISSTFSAAASETLSIYYGENLFTAQGAQASVNAELLLEGNEVVYPIDVWAAGPNVYTRIRVFDAAWNLLEGYQNEDIYYYISDITTNPQPLKCGIPFTQTGGYIIYVEARNDEAATEAEQWTGYQINLTIKDPNATSQEPTVQLLSPLTAKVGTPYTLKIQLDAPEGFLQCWPKVSVWGNFDPWPSVLSNDWWEIAKDATSYTYENTVTFTAAGPYVVGLYSDNPIKDNKGASLPLGELGTIEVTE